MSLFISVYCIVGDNYVCFFFCTTTLVFNYIVFIREGRRCRYTKDERWVLSMSSRLRYYWCNDDDCITQRDDLITASVLVLSLM